MARINIPATIEAAPPLSQPFLRAVQAQLGAAPNMFRLTAQSPAAIEMMASAFAALGKSSLGAGLREQIALTVANVNGCDYCNSAHTYLGREVAKLSEAEVAAAREGRSDQAKTSVALAFARKIALSRADVTEADLETVRRAGYSDEELVDIVAVVALNVFTNYINEVFKTDVDFPRFEARRAA
jgi:uncharacterized peroxidase-related enzyme